MRYSQMKFVIAASLCSTIAMSELSSAQGVPQEQIPPVPPQQPPQPGKPVQPPITPELQDKLDRFAEVVADTIARSHNVATWRQKNVIQADLKIEATDIATIECTIMHEVHRGRTRIDFKAGGTVIIDGESASISPETSTLPDGITDPSSLAELLAMPFRMRDRGVHPSQYKVGSLKHSQFDSIKITYAEESSKPAGDWRTVFADPKSHLLHAVANVPGFKIPASAEHNQRICAIFEQYTAIETVRLATKWTLYNWDTDIKGESIGTVTLMNMKFIVPVDGTFNLPEGSRSLD